MIYLNDLVNPVKPIPYVFHAAPLELLGAWVWGA